MQFQDCAGGFIGGLESTRKVIGEVREKHTPDRALSASIGVLIFVDRTQ